MYNIKKTTIVSVAKYKVELYQSGEKTLLLRYNVSTGGKNMQRRKTSGVFRSVFIRAAAPTGGLWKYLATTSTRGQRHHMDTVCQCQCQCQCLLTETQQEHEHVFYIQHNLLDLLFFFKGVCESDAHVQTIILQMFEDSDSPLGAGSDRLADSFFFQFVFFKRGNFKLRSTGSTGSTGSTNTNFYITLFFGSHNQLAIITQWLQSATGLTCCSQPLVALFAVTH